VTTEVRDPGSELARLLVRAQETRSPLESLRPELVPADAAAAFAVQHRTLALRSQAIGGWKVGAKSLAGPIQGAPLPADRILKSGAVVRCEDYPLLGLELEIAFRFGRVFEPSTEPYADEVVLASVTSMLATIEIVSSRFAQWPDVDKLCQLADLQNHGALACGEAVAYTAAFPFATPSLTFTFDGVDIVKIPVANPAGDPRRLLAWVVNHCTARGIAVDTDVIVTTGSYTGMHFASAPGTIVGQIRGLPPVRLTLA
jgi:2-keto-4-pentenoate hydratase